MPEAKKTSWAQLRVGVMAFVAMLILAVLIFLLTGRKNPFSHNVALFTFMDDSGGMADNSPVRLNGILAGSIDKIELSGSADPRRAVKIEMSIKGEYLREIPEDSICTISASNLLGDKFLNI